MTPGLKCAPQGRSNSAPSLLDYERCNAPIVWPAHLNEDGRVNHEWAVEMMKIRIQFWTPLGARLVWRTTTFSTTGTQETDA